MIDLTKLTPPVEFFPMPEIREKQKAALEFVSRAVQRGYRDIVIAAPTGLGKSGIGSAICFWAAQQGVENLGNDTQKGGYYLVTQKLLQDQMTEDVGKYDPRLRDAISLKSASEYQCVSYGDCKSGLRMPPKQMCPQVKENSCPYKRTRLSFAQSAMSITNYPFFFAERTYVQALKKRIVLVADECHSLEGQLLGFIELMVNEGTVEKYTPHLKLPKLNTLSAFADWVHDEFLPPLEARRNMLKEKIHVMGTDRKAHAELSMIENYLGKCEKAVTEIDNHPGNWVYWQEADKNGKRVSTAKPINAAVFAKELITDMAEVRIYMSAYPGPKRNFCRAIGLDPDEVASASYGSTFDPERRPVHMTFIGSMNRNNIETTQPGLVRQIARIARAHPDEKGVVHTHSYKLGKAVYDFMVMDGQGERVLFPDNSKDRSAAWDMHAYSQGPSILISPSMTEGFNMIDDLARWQVIAKVPYPYLGDEQVRAKKNADPDWYIMQTCMTIIQACGRVMRSHEDHGVTYILDTDFKRLYLQNSHFFPKWFTAAFKWYD